MFRKIKRIKRSFSPFYLAILSGIILAILIINGFLEINRAKKGFYLLLEREATILIQHFEGNVRETLTLLQTMENNTGRHLYYPSPSGFFFGLEESIAEYLLDVMYRVDQIDGEKPLDSTGLRSIVDQQSITSIEIYDPKGALLRAWPLKPPSENRLLLRDLIDEKQSTIINFFGKPLAENDLVSMAIRRRVTSGIIALHLSAPQMKKLFRQFAIQRAISDIGFREGIHYISVQDENLITLAHTDPSFPGKKEEDPFLITALRTQTLRSRLHQPEKGEEIFEVSKSFSIDKRPAGLIRIGYSSGEIVPLLGQIKKSMSLSIFFFLILGVSAVTLIWVNQNRHLEKIKEMEDQIQLGERLSSLGHLAAGVAHEIRNPLNAMGMGLQRLKREFLPPEESKREEYLSFTNLVLNEIRRVNQIIEQFLTLSRPFDLRLNEGSLGDLLKNLIALFQEEAASQKITLELQKDSGLPLIRMDDEKLTQAFINIMKNGMQAMEKGGTLRIEIRSLKDRVEVAFSDSGFGIPEDQMEKVFNYYYTTKERGVGLGLPIAHRIIEGHGGQLKLESRVGVGTKVTVILPV